MSTEKIRTINGKELLQMELSPIRFIVEDFIPQGFHIFAGMPKVGKSWLLLLLCLKVAQGEKFWNYQTEKGTVLYLCLEDSFNQVQMRLSEITEEAPDNLHFAIMANSLSNGLLEQIDLFLAEHPDTNLIVVDTLQKVRDGGGDSNYYAGDYKDVGTLKSIADKNGIAIIAVQHRRKQKSDDPHISISGSTGMTGAADGSYVLVRPNEKSNDAKLYIRGRDLEEKILSIKFNSDSREWEFISGDTPISDAMKSDSVISAVISYLKEQGEFLGQASELAEKIKLNVKGNVLTRKLKRYENELKKIGIEFVKNRTGEKRELLLVYTPQ
jgi:hypothetical protein